MNNKTFNAKLKSVKITFKFTERPMKGFYIRSKVKYFPQNDWGNTIGFFEKTFMMGMQHERTEKKINKIKELIKNGTSNIDELHQLYYDIAFENEGSLLNWITECNNKINPPSDEDED